MLCSISISPILPAISQQTPWHRDGWKVAAAGYSACAIGLFSLGIFSYVYSKKLQSEKNNSPLCFALRFKAKEKLKISKIVAPCCFGLGIVSMFASIYLYRCSNCQK